MFRVRIEDLPFIGELSDEEEQSLYGGSRTPANHNQDPAGGEEDARSATGRYGWDKVGSGVGL